jgi:cytochrome c-type biogenesis protein CcmE
MDVVNPSATGGRPGPVDDEPSADEQGEPAAVAAPALDLSPRTGPGGPAGAGASAARTGRSGGSRRGWAWIGVLVVLVAAIGFVISRALTDATQFYRTVDEAVAQQADLAGRTFRMEGTVVPGSREDSATGVTFRLMNNGAQVTVHHQGDPPQLFQACIPVVVEGRWTGAGPEATFASSAIIVAHDANYEEKNSARIQEAKAQGAASPECAKQEAVAQR